MLLGPVLYYDLLSMARRPKHFLVRAGYAVVLGAGLLISYSTAPLMAGVGPKNLQYVAGWSQTFFAAFAWLQMLAVLVLTPGLVAASLARENERRTMEYLLASPLSSAEIVLGKLGGRLLYVGLVLLSGQPVFAMAGFLGGVSPEAMLRATLVTLATAVSLTGLSMGIGLTCGQVRNAVTRAYLLLVALLFLPWWLREWIAPLLNWNRGAAGAGWDWLRWAFAAGSFAMELHPFRVLGEITMSPGQPGLAAGSMPLHALTYSAVHGAVGAAAVAWGVWRLRRHGGRTGDRAAKARASRGGVWSGRLVHRPPVWNNALAWRELHADRHRGALDILLKIAVGAVLLSLAGPVLWDGLTRTGSAAVNRLVFGMAPVTILVGTLGLILVVSRAAASITTEKERDTWVAVLSTPLTGRQIIAAKLMGAVYSVRWWLGFLILCSLAQLAVAPWTAVGAVFLMLTLTIHLVYAAALGMACSLRCSSSLRAMGLAVGVALFCGGGYLLCCFPVDSPGTAAEMAFLAPCLPFQLAGTYAIHEVLNPSNHARHIDLRPWIVPALMGVAGYAVAAAVLYSQCVNNFDAWAGRVSKRPAPAKPEPPQAPLPPRLPGR